MVSKLKNNLENILVFGGSGLLGKCLIDNYIDKKKIHTVLNKTRIINKKIKFVSSVNFNSLKNYIKKNHIKVIINLAGLTNIELCEKNEKLSNKTNYILPIKLAKLSKETKIKYVFISTDNFKFKSQKLSENLSITPLNNYGKHKKKSEKDILKIYPKSLIIRTNFYCLGSKKRQSFSDTIMKNIKSNKEIELFKDVYYTPIYGKYLLKYIFELVKKNTFGIFNISSDEKITKYNFGYKLCNIFRLNKKLIKPNYLKKRNNLVKRPFNMALNNDKLKKELNIKIPSINYQLKVMKNDLRLLKR
jgi:dTDP-4-dehydrorhamnose reductase